jgi:hypothetical protein
MTKPRFPSNARRLWFAAGFCASTQTTSTPAGVEKIHKPVQGRLEGIQRAPPPIDKRDVILTGWTAAIARCYRAEMPRRCNCSINSMLFEPAMTMRCWAEQPASAIIGSIILQLVAT